MKDKSEFCYRNICLRCKKTQWANILADLSVSCCRQSTRIITIRNSAWSIVNYILT